MDIPSLTTTVQQLELAFNTSTTWSNVFIGAIAVSSLAYLIAMLFVTSDARQLNKANADLIQAKDEQARTHNEQVANDLRDKDLKIAETKRDATRIETEAQKRE